MTEKEINFLTLDDSDKNAEFREAPVKDHPFGKVSRILSEEDLGIPAVQKMLLNDMDRLVFENNQNKDLRESLYEAKIELAVFRQKESINWAADTFFNLSLSIGSLLIGLGQLSGETSDWVIRGLGFLLLVSSMIIKKKSK